MPSFPTQSLDDITYTIDVAKDAPTFDFDAFQTVLDATAPDHKLVNISQYISNEGKVSLRYTFSKLPGKQLQGYTVTSETLGTVGSVTKQQVATGTQPPTGFLIASASTEAVDAQVSTLTVTSVTSWPTLTSRDGFTTNRTLMRHITGIKRTTVETRVDPSTEPDTGFLVVESSVKPDQNNSTRSIKSTTTVASFITLVSTERDRTFGGILATKTETIVPTGTTAPAFTDDIYESTVEDLDGTHALQTVKQKASGVSWPTFVSKRFDPRKKVFITESRTLKAISSITPSVTIASGNTSVTVVEMESYGGDQTKAWEVTRTTPTSSYNSSSNALIEYDARAYHWPSLMNAYLDNTHWIVGYNAFEKQSILQPITRKTYWVTTSGTPPQPNINTIIPGSICVGDNNNRTGVLHDAYTTYVSIGSTTVQVTYEATTPSFSEFMGYGLSSKSGTAATTSGSSTVTGTGTAFTTDFSVGDTIAINDATHGILAGKIASITNNTTLALVGTASVTVSGTVFRYGSTGGSVWPGTDKCIDGRTVEEIPGCLYRVEEDWATVPSYNA